MFYEDQKEVAMQKAQFVMAVSLLLFGYSAAALAGGTVVGQIIYTAEHGQIVIVAPEGWAFDHEGAGNKDFRALIYPAGADKTKVSTFLYVRIVPRKGYPTLQSFISGEAGRQEAASPGLRVVVRDHPLPMVFGRTAPVNDVLNDKEGSFQSIAYVDEPPVYVILGLSSNDKPGYERAQAAFAEFVNGYHVSSLVGGIAGKNAGR